MQLLGQAAVRLPNLILRGGACDPQNFIWVFHCCSVEAHKRRAFASQKDRARRVRGKGPAGATSGLQQGDVAFRNGLKLPRIDNVMKIAMQKAKML